MLHTKDINTHKRHVKEKEGISEYSLNYAIHFKSLSWEHSSLLSLKTNKILPNIPAITQCETKNTSTKSSSRLFTSPE